MSLTMTADEIVALLASAFPEAGRSWSIEALTPTTVTVTQDTTPSMLRPGGTVSGPSQMAVMDLAAYVLVLANAGPAELAVTSSVHMTFLRRPRPGLLRCDGELLKLGRTLAVIDCRLYSDGLDEPVCQATITYSLSLVDRPIPSAR